jgi:hypothetical protein
MYCPRIYIVAETDKMSGEKIESFEKERKSENIPRDSKVMHQSVESPAPLYLGNSRVPGSSPLIPRVWGCGAFH